MKKCFINNNLHVQLSQEEVKEIISKHTGVPKEDIYVSGASLVIRLKGEKDE